MYAAELLENVDARPQQQMVRVREQDLNTAREQDLAALRAHGGMGSHGHEGRGEHLVVGGREPCGARTRPLCGSFELEIQTIHRVRVPPNADVLQAARADACSVCADACCVCADVITIRRADLRRAWADPGHSIKGASL